MSSQNRRRFRFSFKINEDTMTSIVVYSLLFCVAVDVVAIVFAWFDKDISAIVSCNHLLFGTELGVCGLMKIFDKRVEHQEKQAEESRMRAEARRRRKTAKDTEAKREYEEMRG